MGQQIEFALRQSMHRVLVVLVSFLPGLLAFLVAVLLFRARRSNRRRSGPADSNHGAFR